jgi:hypothetical protein
MSSGHTHPVCHSTPVPRHRESTVDARRVPSQASYLADWGGHLRALRHWCRGVVFKCEDKGIRCADAFDLEDVSGRRSQVTFALRWGAGR